MVKGPKISVVIPVYNVADYLSRCLESLRRQTLLDIEIICVNDGSTDNSDEIIREQMKIDSRIQLIDKQNAGVAAARNTGIDAATGDMIVFLDPDDYLTTNIPNDLFVIGNIDVNELENTGVVCSKIQGLNMNDLKEVFYLGGKR